MNFLYHLLSKLNKSKRSRRMWKRLVKAVGCVLVFITIYMLILPAITVERKVAEDMAGFELDDSDELLLEYEIDEVTGEVIIRDTEEETVSDFDVYDDLDDAVGMLEEGDMILDDLEDVDLFGEFETEEETEAKTGIAAETVTAAETEIITEAWPEAGTEGETETKTETGTETETETGTETETEAETETETEAGTEAETEAETETETEVETETEAEAYPERNFAAVTKHVQVLVTSPEGAFPEGTRMSVEEVDDDETLTSIADAVENDSENGNIKVSRIHAVNITFRNAEGEEIEPLLPVKVIINPVTAVEGEQALFVHLDDEGTASMMEQKEDTSFEADSFSIYALVTTVLEKSVLASDGLNYKISVTYDDKAGIPEGSVLQVKEIVENSEEYDAYVEKAGDVIAEDEKVAFARFFDITIVKDGEEIQPEGPVEVKISLADELDETVKAVHFEHTEDDPVEEAVEAVLMDAALVEKEDEDADNSVVFETSGFSVFGVVLTETITTRYLSADGVDYVITVSYGPEAMIPENASLAVEEIFPSESEADSGVSLYEEYAEKTMDALGWEDEIPAYFRLFDIKIVDENGEKVEIAAPVEVKAELADRDSSEEAAENTQIVHFADGADTGDVVGNVDMDGTALGFEAEGFSVYAIVEGPEPASLGWQKVKTIADVIELGEEKEDGSGGLYIGHVKGYYFTNNTTTTQNPTRTGITKTKPAKATPADAAVKYYFEQGPDPDQVYVYCYSNTNEKQYVYSTGNNNSLSFSTEENKTAFTISVDSNGKFKLHNGAWYWNMQGSEAGTRFCSYNKADDANNELYFWFKQDCNSDPYELEGTPYTLLIWDGGKTGKALSTVENQDYPGNLCAEFLTVMTNNSDDTLKLFVPNNSSEEAASWTFKWQQDDLYKMAGTIYTRDEEGKQVYSGTKYLKIDSNGFSMVDNAEDASDIQVVPGTGIHAGQIVLKSGGNVLTYSSVFAEGFNINQGAGHEYLYLSTAGSEEQLSDYFRTYTAQKISVSDPSLTPDPPTEKYPDGVPKKVILYTRVWNGSGYKYFAINGAGEMIPCFESGNEIEWVGSELDELQWEFTEYGTWEGDQLTPNHYYELYNPYSRKYLAPLISGDQILSDSKIGLNMNGRRNGQYYTPVLSWDEDNYSFASIGADLDTSGDAMIEPCHRADGMDIYFAIINELDVDDTLHTVPTVDNNMYGITMRIVDFKTKVQGVGCTTSQEQTEVLVNNKYVSQVPASNLLSTNLNADGYPTAVLSGRSLGDLYAAASDVNHLFVESTYKATGYYEYDSAQNFASLKGNQSGDFTVYQEIGTYDGSDRWTLKHGQFLPYNDLVPGHYASTNGRNQYTPTAALDPNDPRYNEQLYLVDNVNNYFGVELTASFYQTPSGLDAWGHDIIFEFSGDDDFWLYVDGELVIDLGGIHSALPGSVNFRTGDVYVNGKRTTLYDLFYEHYTLRDGLTDSEARALLATKFETKYDEELNRDVTVFTDNSNHTMRIFYMERGAGASNLHMRFNLAAVETNTVQLSKELDVNGADMSDSVYATFPYQIWYKDPLYNPDSTDHNTEYVQLTEETLGNKGSVKYLDSTNEVAYKKEIYVDNTNSDGVECSVRYDGVYLVDPGETIVITFPIFGETGEEKFVSEYKVVECGLDPNVYTEVTLNDGTVLAPVEVDTDIRVVERDAHGNPAADGIISIPEVNSGLCNYEIVYDSPENRSRVKYKNKVEETQELLLQKNLYRKEGENDPVLIPKSEFYDENGDPKDPDSSELKITYDFRVAFKTPTDAEYTPAHVYDYHVKDAGGYYCKWHPTDNTGTNPNEEESKGYFERILHNGQGVSDFDDLTDDTIVDGQIVHGEKFYATFSTSINGSVSRIPAYYTVEIQGLIPGTQFQVVERPNETPDGYEFYRYELDDTPVYPQNSEGITDPLAGVEGIIAKDRESEVLIDNYKGYALRLYKTWADAATMADRDPAYFAVYYETKDTEGAITRELVEDSVLQLDYSADPQELCWFYLHLPGIDQDAGRVFSNFVVREVTLTGNDIAADENGVVSGYSSVTVVEDGGVMKLEGISNSEDAVRKEITYKVTYAEPQTVGTSLRKFRVTNAPSDKPAVKLLKKDWSDSPLEGAAFTLTQGTTQIFEKTSDANGLISIEHLTDNTDYVLKETVVPQGYYGIQQPLTFRLVADASSGWTLDVTPDTGDITSCYEVGFEQFKNDAGVVTDEYVTLTVKNRPYDLLVIKEDSLNNTKLQGVGFELYKQTKVGEQTGWSKDPMTWDGNSELLTDENGIVPHIDSNLPAGTYQLREEDPASGYSKTEPIDFTTNELGVVALGNHPDHVTLDGPTEGTGEQEGKLVYTLTVPNSPLPLTLRKEDESGDDLVGALFSLNRKGEKLSGDGDRMWEPMPEPFTEYNNIDLTETASIELSMLPDGNYRLEEIKEPDGYAIMERYFYFMIETTKTGRTIKLCDEDGAEVEDGTYDTMKLTKNSDGSYKFTVKNIFGVELPDAGGPGTRMICLTGILLALLSGILLAAGKRSPLM